MMQRFTFQNIISIVALALGLLLSNVSTAEELIYGPEWTFTNQDLLDSSQYSVRTASEMFLEAFDKIDAHYAKLCPTLGCQYNKQRRTLTLGSEMVIEFTQDEGVIELKATPLSLKAWKKRQAFLQEHIFNALASIGLAPHEREGAGHLNIGLNYFTKKPLLFRNFIIDFYNHPGLGTVLNSLQANAKDARYIADMMVNGTSPILVTPENLQAMQKNLTKFDANPQSTDIATYKDNALPFTNSKYVALAVHTKYNTPQAWRLEVRALRPQQNMQDFVSAIEIFEANIKYIEKTFSGPLELLPPKKVTDGWKALGEFADYIDRTGLKWQNYRNLIPEVWRHLDEKNFIRGNNQPRMKSGANLCQSIFR